MQFGQVGAGVERPAVVDRVQRIERDEAGVQILRHPVDHLEQIA